jgi:hypothetical protein
MARKTSLNILWIILGAVAVLGIVAYVVISIFFKPYMAVYLTTGDIYFGKVSNFPCIKISDAWFLQRSEDGNLGLQKFSDAVWLPTGEIKISRDQVVFTAKLSKDSPIIQAIEGKAVPQQQVPVNQGNNQQNTGGEQVIDNSVIDAGAGN